MGAWRSMRHLPPITRMPRVAAASKNASAECACTVQNEATVVVPLTQALVEEQRGHGARVRRVRELLLGDERVFFQPVEQLLAVGADDLRLRIVDVAVDEAGQDQARPGRTPLYGYPAAGGRAPRRRARNA